jgi:hypothetical protein
MAEGFLSTPAPLNPIWYHTPHTPLNPHKSLPILETSPPSKVKRLFKKYSAKIFKTSGLYR